MADMALQLVVSPLLGVVFDKVSDPIVKELALLGGVDKDLKKLSDTVSTIRRELRRAAGKKIKSEYTQNWFYRLEDASKEAVEILNRAFPAGETAAYEPKQVRLPLSTWFNLNTVAFRHKIGKKVKSVRAKFDALSAERSSLDFEEIPIDRETGSALSEPKVLGREEEAEEIINNLLSHQRPPTDSPSIYSIVGLGGIGKTAFAQWILKDTRVLESFKPVLWVWVSETFDVKILMRKLIENISGSRCELESLDTVQKKLKELLQGKKFLLVLDDMWNEDVNEWNELSSSLRCGASGSSIVLTTRQSNVALTVGSHHVHKLRPLSQEDCWSLFKKYAFRVKNTEECGDLEAIGKEIVKKCGGFPLLAKTLGSSLQSTKDVNEWMSVRDSYLLDSGDISRILELSSDRLESTSRNCFAFTSIFPKGYEMKKQELIHLWMANDLVPSSRRSEQPEDVGNKIFNELVSKSFFEFPCDSRDFVKMHDLMHELAWSIGGDCLSLEGHDVDKIPREIVHLRLAISVADASATNILKNLSRKHPFLRTCILADKKYFSFPHPRTMLIKNPDCYNKLSFNNLDCLRALDLTQIVMQNLPKSIGKMKHLKYLNLSMTNLTHLPNAICNLVNLQTLILVGCWIIRLPDGIARMANLRNLDLSHCQRLTYLPDGITGLTNLGNLDLSGCGLIHLPESTNLLKDMVRLSRCNLTHLPKGMGQLVFLRKLDWFVVGIENGHKISELRRLNQLRGKLEIRCLENVRHAREAEEAKLIEKKSLSSLSLIWGELKENHNSGTEVEGVLEALQPAQSLNRTLVIKGYGGSVFATWMKLLKNLVEIKLQDCTKCEQLSPLGQLPHLKVLTLVGMNSLKCIGTEFYGSSCNERRVVFPLLEELRLKNMLILEKWRGIEVNEQTSTCPCLKRLVLTKCPNLTKLPSSILSFLQQLEIYKCDKVIVRSLPSLTSLKLHGGRTSSLTSFLEGSLQNLFALKSLKIGPYDKLICLPKQLLNLTSLKTLWIYMCPALQSLPEMGSSSVETTIGNCVHLQELQYLKSLQMLTIRGCHHELHLRCEKEKGEYWPFISNIPQLNLEEFGI